MDPIAKNYLKAWVSAMRLRTIPLSVSGIIIGACLAQYNGFFKWNIFLLALCTAISLQVLSNLANDYGDGLKGTDNSDRIGPERALQSGVISPGQMYNAIKFNIVIVIFFAFILIMKAFGLNNFIYSLIFFVLGGLSIIAAIRYTVGDSAYGYKGLGDVFVFIFFGLVSVIGSYFLFAKQIDHVLFLPAVCVGLLSIAVLNLNNMRDIESDKKANKITLAVKLGPSESKRYHLALIISVLILSLIFGVLYYNSPFNFLFLLTFIPLIFHLKFVRDNDDPKLLDSHLKILALSTFTFSILLGIGQIL
ncbi:MAG: 1,4-dihydroxy-2-naphthoate octaprenyltransferase [Bacteroidia bacterium]|nr:1,4-dihydroxy-2-naphthoate octaprenyltransferase [Bacteroidia bacterium]